MEVKKRHYRLLNFLRPFVKSFFKHKYGFTSVLHPELKNTPFILVSNHVTQVDPVLVSLAFKQHIYYVATENVFQRKWISKLLVYFFSPIKKVKNEVDIGTIRDMMSVAKQGGSLGLFLSGNATYSGEEEYIHSPIAGLIKKLGLPLVIYNLYGCYGVAPRWGNELRKGKCFGDIRRIITPEEYSTMSNEELEEIIHHGLDVKETDKVESELYDCPNRAEYLERALFCCPDCHSFQTLKSEKHTLKCLKCGYEVTYEKGLKLTTIKGEKTFARVKEWYDFEKNYVASYDFQRYNKMVVLKDKGITIRDIHEKSEAQAGTIELYNDSLHVITDQVLVIPFTEITSMAAQSKNNLLVKTKTVTYEINGNVRRSALAYLMIFYSIKNKEDGQDESNRFLGI
ncbi:MAG: lysophospholipid acyltransferase family protein [Bacilli bacterium]|nr:lysophospholipid acyltransferase family protein [Bacilli bacterium]